MKFENTTQIIGLNMLLNFLQIAHQIQFCFAYIYLKKKNNQRTKLLTSINISPFEKKWKSCKKKLCMLLCISTEKCNQLYSIDNKFEFIVVEVVKSTKMLYINSWFEFAFVFFLNKTCLRYAKLTQCFLPNAFIALNIRIGLARLESFMVNFLVMHIFIRRRKNKQSENHVNYLSLWCAPNDHVRPVLYDY